MRLGLNPMGVILHKKLSWRKHIGSKTCKTMRIWKNHSNWYSRSNEYCKKPRNHTWSQVANEAKPTASHLKVNWVRSSKSERHGIKHTMCPRGRNFMLGRDCGELLRYMHTVFCKIWSDESMSNDGYLSMYSCWCTEP